MAIPGLPRSVETNIFRTYEAILREDWILKGVIKTWRTWDGRSPIDDDAPMSDESGLPFLRLTPQPSQLIVAEVQFYKIGLMFLLELGVQGTNADDLLDLWAQIRNATVNAGETRGTTPMPAGTPANNLGRLRAAGATDLQYYEPAIFPARIANTDFPIPAKNLRVSARLKIEAYVPF